MSEQSIPADVIWARGARFHLHAVYMSAGIVALLTLLGVAAIAMAGPRASDPPITAGVLALLIGGVGAVTGAVSAGLGQLRVLQAAGRTGGADGADGAGTAATPQSSEAAPLRAVEQILERTRAVFAFIPRLMIAGCVALAAGYSIWAPAGIWGTVVGLFVVVQAALALGLIRKFVLDGARLRRR